MNETIHYYTLSIPNFFRYSNGNFLKAQKCKIWLTGENFFLYKGHSINKMKLKILELETLFTVAPFFMEINCDRSFHVSKDCQYDFLY